MDMSSLFPSEAVGATPPSPSDGSVHVTFKAGILNMDDSSKRMTADPRRGDFQIRTSMEDGLVHIVWKPRDADVEKDLILINGETEMKQVMSCPSSARVYVLKWHESDTRLFLWMQDADASQDSERLSLVNHILANGPPGQQFEDEQDEQQVEQDADHQMEDSAIASPSPASDQVQIPPSTTVTPQPSTARDIPPASPAAPAASAASAPTGITLEQIRAALSGGGGGGGGAGHGQLVPTPRDLLQLDVLGDALSDPAVQSRLPTLFDDVPPADRSVDGIRALLRSGELESQAANLSSALTSGHDADDLLRGLGIDSQGSAPTFGSTSAAGLIDALKRIQRENGGNDNNNSTS